MKMSPKAITYITIGATIGIGYIVYRQIKKAKLLREFGDLSVITNDNKGNTTDVGTTGSEDVIQGSDFDPAPVVEDLHYSMYNGWTFWGYTDEELLESTLASLSCEEMEIVKDFWSHKYDDSLRTWVIEDTSGDLKTRCLRMIDGTDC